ncbi:CLUMA_CG017969, isoform A [Clunio marinus]|uniref:CLUMA_CG017969, isoform A n=1 Tax=Clunio marinus TaxID=568069 RepID=A0A1J1J0V3_9DIPT|nr:CLUMA_CG017969, isoform A [Clunio marinus]
MILSLKLFLILTSVAITPIKCATCRFKLYDSQYCCEIFDANVTEKNQPFDIIGEHLPGYSNTDVKRLNVAGSGILNFIPKAIFETFINLEVLSIWGVQLKEIHQETFQDCKLSSLHLDRNNIKKIPSKAFSGCPLLTVLSLYGNTIETVEDYAISELGLLKHLILSNNELKTLPENAFANLSELQNLDLDNNKIDHLPENIFSTLGSLETLNLDRNSLVSIPPKLLSGCNSLKMFHASSNSISSIHPNTFNRHLIELIDLSQNNLKEIAPGTFQMLNHIKKIRLNSNHISSLPNESFSGCISQNLETIESVNISSNELTCEGLEALNLYDNELEIIHSNFFVNMTRLMALNLSSNKISAINRDMFKFLPKIEFLFLSNNTCTSKKFTNIKESKIPKIEKSLEKCFNNYDEL